VRIRREERDIEENKNAEDKAEGRKMEVGSYRKMEEKRESR
jgi:hypothetical protein